MPSVLNVVPAVPLPNAVTRELGLLRPGAAFLDGVQEILDARDLALLSNEVRPPDAFVSEERPPAAEALSPALSGVHRFAGEASEASRRKGSVGRLNEALAAAIEALQGEAGIWQLCRERASDVLQRCREIVAESDVGRAVADTPYTLSAKRVLLAILQKREEVGAALGRIADAFSDDIGAHIVAELAALDRRLERGRPPEVDAAMLPRHFSTLTEMLRRRGEGARLLKERLHDVRVRVEEAAAEARRVADWRRLEELTEASEELGALTGHPVDGALFEEALDALKEAELLLASSAGLEGGIPVSPGGRYIPPKRPAM